MTDKTKMRKRTLLFLAAIWIVVTSMNITKAVHIDDTAYLEIARQIVQQPLHPMSGMLNWGDTAEPIHRTNSPLLIPYIYAAIMGIFGESEIALHTVMSLFSLAAMTFFYLLARRLAVENAALLTAAFCLGPVFMTSQNLMLDVPVAALWLAFFWMIICLNPGRHGALGHALAAVVCGIACLTKYVSIVLVPILALDIALRKKWNRMWVTGIPILFLAGWSLMNYLDYGGVHLFSRKVREFEALQVGRSLVEWILCLGAISPFFLWLLPYWTAKKNGRVYLAACALLSAGIVVIGLLHMDGFGSRAFLRGLFLGSGALVLLSVLHLLIRALVVQILDAEPENTAHLACLLTWISGIALFIILFAPFAAVRHLITVIPVVLLIFGKFVLPELKKPWIYAGVTATILLGTLLAVSDWKYADVYRSSAQEIRSALEANSRIWYRGHWGWQWYAKRAGMEQYDMAGTIFRKGDYLVVPFGVHMQQLSETQEPQLRRIRTFSKPSDWTTLFRTMTLFDETYGGFYNSDIYHHLPWTIASETEIIYVFRAMSDRESVKWTATEGLYVQEGHYLQWGLPAVRWGGGVRTRITFDGDGQPLVLSMTCGKNHLEWQEIAVSLNGEELGNYRFDTPDEFKEIMLPLTARNGHNVLEIEYQNQDDGDSDRPLALLFKRFQIMPPELAGYIRDISDN